MHSTAPSLLERLRQRGQQQAWEHVQLYTPLLCQWARRLGLNEADTADLVQDVFLRIYRKLPDFVYAPEKSFRGWLRTVMLNHWRNVQARRKEQPIDGNPNNVAAPAESDLLEAEDYRKMLIGRAVRLMKDEFPENVWQPFWMYAVEGQPPAGQAARKPARHCPRGANCSAGDRARAREPSVTRTDPALVAADALAQTAGISSRPTATAPAYILRLASPPQPTD